MVAYHTIMNLAYYKLIHNTRCIETNTRARNKSLRLLFLGALDYTSNAIKTM